MKYLVQVRQQRTAVIILVLLVALPSVWFGRHWWIARKLQSFQSQCQSAKDKMDWNTLAAISAEWVEWQPSSGKGWAMRALASQENGDLSAAAGFLEKIPDEDAIAIPAFIELSGLYFEQLRRPLDGVRICRRILNINPQVVAAHQRLAHYYAMTLQRTLALEQVRESIRQRAESVDAYCYFVTLPDLVFDDALSRVDLWLEISPDEPSLQISRALLRVRDDSVTSGNDFEEKVLQELRDLYQTHPDNLELLTTLLEILSRRGDRSEVGSMLENSPTAAAGDHRMWRIRSWYSQSGGDLKLAEENLRESIRLNPMDWQSWHQLSALMRQLTRIEEAVRAQEIAKFGKDLQAVLLNLLTPKSPPKEALEGVLDYATACGDEFVIGNLSRRLGRSIPRPPVSR